MHLEKTRQTAQPPKDELNINSKYNWEKDLNTTEGDFTTPLVHAHTRASHMSQFASPDCIRTQQQKWLIPQLYQTAFLKDKPIWSLNKQSLDLCVHFTQGNPKYIFQLDHHKFINLSISKSNSLKLALRRKEAKGNELPPTLKN